jgi:hypothetical protein
MTPRVVLRMSGSSPSCSPACPGLETGPCPSPEGVPTRALGGADSPAPRRACQPWRPPRGRRVRCWRPLLPHEGRPGHQRRARRRTGPAVSAHLSPPAKSTLHSNGLAATQSGNWTFTGRRPTHCDASCVRKRLDRRPAGLDNRRRCRRSRSNRAEGLGSSAPALARLSFPSESTSTPRR